MPISSELIQNCLTFHSPFTYHLQYSVLWVPRGPPWLGRVRALSLEWICFWGLSLSSVFAKRKKEKNKEGRVLTSVSQVRFAASHLTFAEACSWGPEAGAGMGVQICCLPPLVSCLQLGGNKVKVPQDRAFLRGFVTLLGLLVGLTLEGALVGSQPKYSLLEPLSMRGCEHWEGLLPRIKANIGITCFDLKKKKVWIWSGARGKQQGYCVLCGRHRGQLHRLGTCCQEPPECRQLG